MSETGEGPRIRLTPKSNDVSSDNPGLAFWNKLNPDRKRSLAKPIRDTEITIAQAYPDGFKSPLVDKVNQSRGELEGQIDMTSCTYHATANALRVLDEPRAEYSKDHLKANIEALIGHPQTTINQTDLERIFTGGVPFNKFITRTISNLQLRIGKAPEMVALFQHLAKGAVGVVSWFKQPETVTRGAVGTGRITETIFHARTLVGFEKGPENSIKVHVIDPYGAKHEVWSFRDWYVGLHMDVFGNERGYSDDNVVDYAIRMRERGVIGSTAVAAAKVWLIEKKKPPIVIRKHT